MFEMDTCLSNLKENNNQMILRHAMSVTDMSSDVFVGKIRKVLRHEYIRGALGVSLVIFKMIENWLVWYRHAYRRYEQGLNLMEWRYPRFSMESDALLSHPLRPSRYPLSLLFLPFFFF